MTILSLTIYFIIAIWFLGAEKAKSKRIAMIVGICVSSFFAPLFLAESILMFIVCCILGTLCVYMFHIWSVSEPKQEKSYKKKSKFIAAAICAVVPTFGIQYFYLRQWTKGLLCLLFWWTGIPTLLSICQAVYFMIMSKQYFESRYANLNNSKECNYKKPVFTLKKDDSPIHIFSNLSPQEVEKETTVDNAEKSLNIKNIHTVAGLCNVKGSIEDFVVTVYRDNKRFDFYVKDGQLKSYKSPQMEKPAEYAEVG